VEGRQVRAHMTDLARELGKLRTPEGETPWVRLHYVYPYPHVDAVIPLMAEGLLTPYLDIPFQHASPNRAAAMKRPANEAKVLERMRNHGAQSARYRNPLQLRRGLSRRDAKLISNICWNGWTKRN
jgi:tRNA A37 methylthiotransferase MiaB